MKLAQIKPNDVKEALDFLQREKGGCYHFVVWTEPETMVWNEDETEKVPHPHSGREYCIVIGWSDGYDTEPDPDYYQDEKDPSWRIVAGIRYQGPNNGMQTDMDIDFDMPSIKDTGDCYDISFAVPRGEGDDYYGSLAEDLNSDARDMYEWVQKNKEEIE